MPMTVNFIIRGSAICYLDNAWRVIFITDETHPVNFAHNSTSAPKIDTLRVPKTDRDIFIFVDKPVNPTPGKGPNFDDILNMAAEYMHGHPKVKVKKTPSPGREIITMTLPVGILDRKDLTPRNYYIEQVTPIPTGKIDLGRKVASSIKINMKLNRGSGMSMVIQERGEPTTLLTFPYRDGFTLNLNFDNDCGQDCKTENDFGMYYDWVKDIGEIRRFSAGKLDVAVSLQGNCDPVSIDPPPGIEP
jgi:hypothetical protein